MYDLWRFKMNNLNTVAKHVYKKWEAELASKDRSRSAVSDNFSELFYELWKASVTFEIAESYVSQAIKAHLPAKTIAGLTYKRLKPQLGGVSFHEFMDDWKKNISSKAWDAFYTQYPIDGVEEKEEKKFGSMSVQEYNKQRKYVESFPVLDIEALKKKREEFMKQEDEDGEA